MILYDIDNIRDLFGHKVNLGLYVWGVELDAQYVWGVELDAQYVWGVELDAQYVWGLQEMLEPMGLPPDVTVIAWGLSLE
eukprot:gene23111-27964_t